MLRALHISGFRAIRELDVDKLGQVNVLIGRAGCGKSSVLEGLAVAAFVLYGSEQPVSKGALDMLKYVAARHGASSSHYYAGLSIELGLIPAKRLSFNYVGSFSTSLTGMDGKSVRIDVALHERECSVKRCWVEIEGEARELGGLPARHYISELEDMAINSLAGLVFIDGIFMRCVFDLPGPWEKFFTEGYDRRACEALTEVLGVEVEDMRTIPRGEGRFDVLVSVRSGERTQRLFLGDMAEGARGLLSVILGAIYVGEKGTLLMEEPEMHLHPLGMVSLADLIADISKRLGQQAFISTHSMEMADAISKACEKRGAECRIIFLHRRPDGFVEARVLMNNQYRELREMGLDLRTVPEIL